MAISNLSFAIKRYDGTKIGNYIDSQYLGDAYETGAPHMFEGTLAKIFATKSDYFVNKPLLSQLGYMNGGVKEIETEVFRWKLAGAEYVAATILENLDPTNTAPGLNGGIISLKLDQAIYSFPEVMIPEDSDFPLAIVEGPIEDGIGAVYRFKIQTDNPSTVVPAHLLQPGQRMSKVWTSTPSERNEWGGGIQAGQSFMLESQLGTFAQTYEVTDKAMREQGRMNIGFYHTDHMGKQKLIKNAFLPYAEARSYDELYMSIEAQSWLGKKSITEGPGKYTIRTGTSVQESLKDGFTEYTNTPITATKLRDYLLDVSFSRLDQGNRKFVGNTGQLGSMNLHDMLATEASSFLTLDTNFTKSYAGGPGANDLQFGGQYRKYIGPEGIEFILNLVPIYDNLRYSPRRHPTYTEFPLNSARYTFLNFGTSKGEKNVQMLKLKDFYRWNYVVGTVGPNGPIKGGTTSSHIAGYSTMVEDSCGIMITDPTDGKQFTAVAA